MIEWPGFAVGLVLLTLTASSVVKTFLIPRATRTRVNKVVSVTVLGLFRLLTARIDNLARRRGAARVRGSSVPALPARDLAGLPVRRLHAGALAVGP